MKHGDETKVEDNVHVICNLFSWGVRRWHGLSMFFGRKPFRKKSNHWTPAKLTVTSGHSKTPGLWTCGKAKHYLYKQCEMFHDYSIVVATTYSLHWRYIFNVQHLKINFSQRLMSVHRFRFGNTLHFRGPVVRGVFIVPSAYESPLNVIFRIYNRQSPAPVSKPKFPPPVSPPQPGTRFGLYFNVWQFPFLVTWGVFGDIYGSDWAGTRIPPVEMREKKWTS